MNFQERYDLAKSLRESLDESQSVELSPAASSSAPAKTSTSVFRYTAADGSEKWATATTKVITHPAFDLMAEDHRAHHDRGLRR